MFSHLISVLEKQLRVNNLNDLFTGPKAVLFILDHFLPNTFDLFDKFLPVVLVVELL